MALKIKTNNVVNPISPATRHRRAYIFFSCPNKLVSRRDSRVHVYAATYLLHSKAKVNSRKRRGKERSRKENVPPPRRRSFPTWHQGPPTLHAFFLQSDRCNRRDRVRNRLDSQKKKISSRRITSVTNWEASRRYLFAILFA